MDLSTFASTLLASGAAGTLQPKCAQPTTSPLSRDEDLFPLLSPQIACGKGLHGAEGHFSVTTHQEINVGPETTALSAPQLGTAARFSVADGGYQARNFNRIELSCIIA